MNAESTKKIKTAYVLCGLSYGGAERLVLDLIKNLDKEKFSIYLITIKGGGELLPEFQTAGINIYLLNKKSRLGILTIWRLKKYLQKEQIDIIHTHLFAGDTWGRLAAILAKVPVIISTEHNVNLDEGIIKKTIKRWLSHFTKKIVAVSRAVKEYQIDAEKIDPAKIQIVYNGIDLAKFPFLTDYQLRQPLTLGIIGRLEPQKGHLVTFNALSLILKKYSLTKLMIIGQGSQKKILEQAAKNLKIEKNLIWQPPQENVGSVLNQLDLLLIPSLWEGLGLIALEALSVGLPVVASNIHGLKEVITNEETGFLVEPNNPEQLAEKIINIIDHPENLTKTRTKGREKVETFFEIRRMTTAYQKIYLELYENTSNQ